jgi:small subunit ribosomal protein S2
MKLPTVLEMLKAGVHFGHQKSRWHPKMKEFIFTDRNGIHVIDLEKSLEMLEKATNFTQKTAQNGGVILFVGTKKQGQKIMEKYAKEVGMPYIVERWVGGLFTNFANVGKLIKKYGEMKASQASGGFDKYTKKEQVAFKKKIAKLEKLVGGLESVSKTPDAIFVLDVKKEKTAVIEARKKNIPVIAFCDTNINPDLIDYVIPANDDAVKSIELIVKIIAEAIKEGKAKQENK